MDLPRAISVILRKSGKNQKEVAEAMGIDPKSTTFLRDVMSGKRSPTIGWLERFCKAMGISVCGLIAIAEGKHGGI